MNLSNHNQSFRIPWWQRGMLLIGGAGMILLLVVAATLKPDPRGLGTHQGLGLPPCSFRQWTGMRCPSCGMTTSWSHLTRGDVVGAFQSNVGGALLGVTSMLLGPWFVLSSMRGNWFWRTPGEWLPLILVLSLLGITLIDWTIRVLMGQY